MPHPNLSTARLRAYGILDDQSLGTPLEFTILNSVLAARLWLPISLTEIAFRNLVDRVASEGHPDGPDWLFAPGRRPQDGGPVYGNQRLVREHSPRQDPIQDAADAARKNTGRVKPTRDDIVAHLMFGFWVVRAPDALNQAPSPLGVYDVIAASLNGEAGHARDLRRAMEGEVLRLRNRIAHHESILVRSKHVFTASGEPKQVADLCASLAGAITSFTNATSRVTRIATLLIPEAEQWLRAIPQDVTSDLAATERRVRSVAANARAERVARRMARRPDQQ